MLIVTSAGGEIGVSAYWWVSQNGHGLLGANLVAEVAVIMLFRFG